LIIAVLTGTYFLNPALDYLVGKPNSMTSLFFISFCHLPPATQTRLTSKMHV